MLDRTIKRRKINYSSTEDFRFFSENAGKYAQILSFYHIPLSERNPFRVIQGNILIRSAMNKKLVDDVLNLEYDNSLKVTEVSQNEYLRKKLWNSYEKNNSPYFSVGKARIYIPLFSIPLNIIYNDQCDKLVEYPYNQLTKNPLTSFVDIFDTYGYKVYDSKFTNLVLIKEDKTSAAFYSNDFSCIYIINDQGRLDQIIPLYDKYIKHPEMHHIMSKLTDVVDAYYSSSYPTFVFSLYSNGFISKKTYKKMRKRFQNRLSRKEKFASKGEKND